MGVPEQPLTVVKGLDLQKYQGRWYEIASMPSRFQPKNGKNTTATYTLRPDGTVHVLNETWADGKRASIEGSAWKVDLQSDEAKLKVRFWLPPFLPLFPVTGDYWVMLLDEKYGWALVGQPSRKFLWVLCRTPEMSEEIYSRLLEHARKEGYDTDRLHRTTHDESSPDGEHRKRSDDKGGWWVKSILGK